MSLKIALVGTGNVAHHLALRLIQIGRMPVTVLGRTAHSADEFCALLGLNSNTNAALLPDDLDVAILAVPDREISNVARQLTFPKECTVMHTSGSVSMDVLAVHSRYGVLYPLQTFSRDKEIHFDQVQLLIEGAGEADLQRIKSLAVQLSPLVKVASSHERRQIHLAAVFACNFANYMFHCADQILKDTSLALADLKPLIQETVDKAMLMTPADAQTGPAIRRDENILSLHRELLQNDPKLQDLYQTISLHIQRLRDQ